MGAIQEWSGGAVMERPALDGEIFKRWIRFLDVSAKSIQTYTRCIRVFVEWLQGAGIDRPTREDLFSYREELKATRKPATVQAYMTAVKLFFQWTAQEGIYPNVAERVKGAKVDRLHKKDYLTVNQVKALLFSIDTSTITGKRDFAMIAVMLTTGLREISIARANIEDFRPAGDAAALYYQGKGHEDKAEYVVISGAVEKAMRKYLKARGPAAGKSALFISTGPHNGGGRMRTESISRIVKSRLIKAGLNSDRLTGHSLRHTAATQNLLNGATLEETRQLLGHTNINTTLIYAHAITRANNQSEQRLESVFFG